MANASIKTVGGSDFSNDLHIALTPEESFKPPLNSS